MCGIFAVLGGSDDFVTDALVKRLFQKGQHRGPDHTMFSRDAHFALGFHRLAINGLSETSQQPLQRNKLSLICNGEIYNYKKLATLLSLNMKTESDCEVILHLYEKYGMHHTLELLDGVFSFVLIDRELDMAWIARDPYGVRPLFYGKHGEAFVFASEMKMMLANDIKQFQPGSVSQYVVDPLTSVYTCTISEEHYFSGYHISPEIVDKDAAVIAVHAAVCTAVAKRVKCTDKPIACLLSGGLDSSIIAAVVSKYSKTPLHTYSIGLSHSEDLGYARIVASHIGSVHHEVIVSEDDFFNAIPAVIEGIESYDTTTVRASVGNYLIGKYIKEHSNAKVIFNGDGADEVAGGYLYFDNAPNAYEYDKECKRLLKSIHFFDVLRSDRAMALHGLEARTPFLDKAFVRTYLSIPATIRFHPGNNAPGKYLIRKAFASYLPPAIVSRRKEAFSDGVSGLQRSWFQIIQEKVSTLSIDRHIETYSHNSPSTLEQHYYRSLFEKTYPNCATAIPYFWMPKYTEASDASARTLAIY